MTDRDLPDTWHINDNGEIEIYPKDRPGFYAAFETEYYGNDLDLAELGCLFHGADDTCDGVRILVNVDPNTGTAKHALVHHYGKWLNDVRGNNLTFGQFCEGLVDAVFYFEPL